MPTDKYIKPDDRNDRIIDEFVRKLGKPKPVIVVQDVDLGSQMTVLSSSQARDWPVPAALHDWAVQRVLEAPPAQRGWPEQISCTCHLDFRLRDPDSGEVLEGQATKLRCLGFEQIRSTIMFSISSGNTSAIFDLAFPFEKPDADFIAYVTKIRPLLPIRLAKGNFKQYARNKAGNGLNRRRMDASLFAKT